MPRGVHADPEELERFASELKHFNEQLNHSTRRLSAAFKRVGETWTDQEYQKFAAEFTQTLHMLKHFSESSQQQVPSLLKKARKLREFMNSF